jgi:hypothetical protein
MAIHSTHRADRSTDPGALGPRHSSALGQIAADGAVGLFRLLRRAGRDPMTAGLTASAALRALPGMGVLRSHEVLARAHIREGQTFGELDAAQRVELCRLVNGAERQRRARP